jgi:hypothetical protein
VANPQGLWAWRTADFMGSPKDMEDLQALKRQNTVAAFEAWSQKAAATALPAAAELTENDVLRMVKALP